MRRSGPEAADWGTRSRARRRRHQLEREIAAQRARRGSVPTNSARSHCHSMRLVTAAAAAASRMLSHFQASCWPSSTPGSTTGGCWPPRTQPTTNVYIPKGLIAHRFQFLRAWREAVRANRGFALCRNAPLRLSSSISREMRVLRRTHRVLVFSHRSQPYSVERRDRGREEGS